MKVHEYFTGQELTEAHKKEMERYSYLVGKTVKAIPVKKYYEEETFTVVGFTTRQYKTEKINCVLKSTQLI